MKKFILLPAMMLACVFLTGCIGLVVAHPRQKCVTRFCLGSRGTLTNGPAVLQLSEAKLLELWGQPDITITNSQALTVLHYQGEKIWGIVMPAYLIGLPIPFPAGHGWVDIYFKDDVAQEARARVSVVTGAMIGIQPPWVFAWEKEPEADSRGFVGGWGFAKEPEPAVSRQ